MSLGLLRSTAIVRRMPRAAEHVSDANQLRKEIVFERAGD